MWKLFENLLAQSEPVPQITADDLKGILDSKKDIILIDVRTPLELTRGKIPGCINIPLDDIEAVIHSQVPDKEKEIYLYCLSGTRSDKAARILLRQGYTTVKSLTNGMLMWRYKKYPIE